MHIIELMDQNHTMRFFKCSMVLYVNMSFKSLIYLVDLDFFYSVLLPAVQVLNSGRTLLNEYYLSVLLIVTIFI